MIPGGNRHSYRYQQLFRARLPLFHNVITSLQLIAFEPGDLSCRALSLNDITQTLVLFGEPSLSNGVARFGRGGEFRRINLKQFSIFWLPCWPRASSRVTAIDKI